MPASEILCPGCRKADQVQKASTIYLDSIGAGRLSTARLDPPAKPKDRLTDLPSKELRSLGRRLTPPSSQKKAFTRLVHPDRMILSFSLFIFIIMAAMLSSQPELLLPAGIILAAFYGLYWILRPKILQRFEREQNAEAQQGRQVEAAIKLWMNLYYCRRENAVFIPGEDELVPPDEMNVFLMKKAQASLPLRARAERK